MLPPPEVPDLPLSRWLPCVACGHDHGFLPCDYRGCDCPGHIRNGID